MTKIVDRILGESRKLPDKLPNDPENLPRGVDASEYCPSCLYRIDLCLCDKWGQYRAGEDDVEIDGKVVHVAVFEFPTDEKLEEFIGDVGGMPHPNGGLRAVVEL